MTEDRASATQEQQEEMEAYDLDAYVAEAMEFIQEDRYQDPWSFVGDRDLPMPWGEEMAGAPWERVCLWFDFLLEKADTLIKQADALETIVQYCSPNNVSPPRLVLQERYWKRDNRQILTIVDRRNCDILEFLFRGKLLLAPPTETDSESDFSYESTSTVWLTRKGTIVVWTSDLERRSDRPWIQIYDSLEEMQDEWGSNSLVSKVENLLKSRAGEQAGLSADKIQ